MSELKELRFRAYSESNNAQEVKWMKIENRFRGCKCGDPVIVWGKTMQHSEDRIKNLISIFESEDYEIYSNRRGSFFIKVHIDEYDEILETYGCEESKVSDVILLPTPIGEDAVWRHVNEYNGESRAFDEENDYLGRRDDSADSMSFYMNTNYMDLSNPGEGGTWRIMPRDEDDS